MFAVGGFCCFTYSSSDLRSSSDWKLQTYSDRLEIEMAIEFKFMKLDVIHLDQKY